MPRKPNLDKQGYRDPFPSALRTLMWENGITQEEIKDVLGLANRQSVTGYVDGSTAPTPEKIIALADYFGVSADYLLGRGKIPNTTDESRTAAKYTGLSERAAAALHDLGALPKSHGLTLSEKGGYIDTASALISSPSFVRLLECLGFVGTIIRDSVNAAPGEDETISKDGIRDIKYAVFDCTETLQDVIDELYHTRAIFKGAANEQG